jgi:hypothetical protein
MTNKFLTIINGVKSLVLAISASSGVADANKIIATDSTGKIGSTLLPAGIGGEATANLIASEAIGAGDFVNIYDNGGVATIRKADASNGRIANGFCLTPIASSATGLVNLRGENSACTGIVTGNIYYLSSTNAGKPTITAPSTNGTIIQPLGYGLRTTSIIFEFDDAIENQI